MQDALCFVFSLSASLVSALFGLVFLVLKHAVGDRAGVEEEE